MHVSKKLLVAAMILFFAVSALCFFLLGQQHPINSPSIQPPESRSINSKSIIKSDPTVTVSKIETPPSLIILPISMSAMTKADSDDLDSGCSGVFASKRKPILFVSEGELIFRPDGSRIISEISNGQFQSFNNDEVTVRAGKYRVHLTPSGVQTPVEDGHSVPAALTVSVGNRATSFQGIWEFGC